MKKEITLRVYDDKGVGIHFKYGYEKPTKAMRLSLMRFLNCELIPFNGYSYSLKDDINIPCAFKLIREEIKPYGTVKEYQGILNYGRR